MQELELVKPEQELILEDPMLEDPSLEERKTTQGELAFYIEGLASNESLNLEIIKPTPQDPYLLNDGEYIIGWI